MIAGLDRGNKERLTRPHGRPRPPSMPSSATSISGARATRAYRSVDAALLLPIESRASEGGAKRLIFDRLLEVANTAPDTSGLRMGGSFASYADIARRTERLAAGFPDRGIRQGSVVALLIPNSPDIFLVAHALFAIGAIAMPLGLTATRSELAALGAKTGLAAVVATPTLRPPRRPSSPIRRPPRRCSSRPS